MISVVVPAHNEETTIGRCIDSLLGGSNGQLEIIVVCNGCSDKTAAIAAQFGPPVVVIDTEVASKSNALNLGDDAANHFPRLYVDADISVTGAALLDVARVLEEDGVMAAAPALRVDLTGCSFAVQAHYRIWCELPYVRQSLIGSGVYGVSEQGRARFDRFPNVIADDYYVRNLFRPHERRSVRNAEFVMRAPRTAKDLIHRKIRVYLGNQQLGPGADPDRPLLPEWLHALARKPQYLPYLPIYLWIAVRAKKGARKRVREADYTTWNRDLSTRIDDQPGSSQ